MEGDLTLSKAQRGQCVDQENTRIRVQVPSELEGQGQSTVEKSTEFPPEEKRDLSAIEECFTEMLRVEADLSNLLINEKCPSPAELIEFLQLHEVEMDEGLALQGKKEEDKYLKLLVARKDLQKVEKLLYEIAINKNIQSKTRKIVIEKRTKYPYYRSLFLKGTVTLSDEQIANLKVKLRAAEIVFRKNCFQVYWEDEEFFFKHEKTRILSFEGKTLRFESVFVKETNVYKAIIIRQPQSTDRYKLYTLLKKTIPELECISGLSHEGSAYVYAYIFKGVKKQRLEEIIQVLKKSNLGKITPLRKKPEKERKDKDTFESQKEGKKLDVESMQEVVTPPKPQKRSNEVSSESHSKVPKADGES